MQGNELGRWLLSRTTLALAILVVAKGGLVDGIRCDDGLSLVAVVVILWLLNELLRPLLLLVAMPLILATFGLFLIPAIWIANAIVLYIVGHSLGMSGFHVATFGSAMWASLWISIIAFFIGKLFGGDKPRGPRDSGSGPAAKRKPDDGDVIDV